MPNFRVPAAMATWSTLHLFQGNGWVLSLLKILRKAGHSGLVDCFLCFALSLAAPFGFLLGSSVARFTLLLLAFAAIAVPMHPHAPEEPAVEG